MIYVFYFVLTIANAGWFSSFCERYLIADDPYEFETYPPDDLGRAIDRLNVARAWRPLTKDEASRLERMTKTLELRRNVSLQK